ncbi:MAG: hypothetical protein CVV64_07285 [Candidatus Wallbacteria bacterium HGW-Wallbacteria-1]|jgi:prepilin-type N-terminal cleavage/methylation domain-containing protein|uniref:General secretion pathway protein GspG n=1 Tax=Candidatus Wallbacteria bacterium HGW-Wallbacteria-1 TaxID=2013854 RepID=A0A2N1PQQ5_9BACT|nr:MAG: hypothetical protein CVV64_07285 [Candidatus Wallbacteria bacterium HGW-Wallbacteria-1]
MFSENMFQFIFKSSWNPVSESDGFNSRGLSLLELLITLSIVAIIASIGLPVAEVKYIRDKEQELKYDLKAFRKGIDDFKTANESGTLPKSVVPGDGVDDDGDGSIDEEIWDDIDNDGDTLVDEDLAPEGFPASVWSMVINHKMRRIVDPPMTGIWQYRKSTGPVDTWYDLIGTTLAVQDTSHDIFDIRLSTEATSLSGSRYDTW